MGLVFSSGVRKRARLMFSLAASSIRVVGIGMLVRCSNSASAKIRWLGYMRFPSLFSEGHHNYFGANYHKWTRCPFMRIIIRFVKNSLYLERLMASDTLSVS